MTVRKDLDGLRDWIDRHENRLARADKCFANTEGRLDHHLGKLGRQSNRLGVIEQRLEDLDKLDKKIQRHDKRVEEVADGILAFLENRKKWKLPSLPKIKLPDYEDIFMFIIALCLTVLAVTGTLALLLMALRFIQ